MRTREFTSVIGNGEDAEILVTHNKNSKTGHIAVRDIASGRQLAPTEYELVFPGPDTLVITFAAAPAADSLELTFTAAVVTELFNLPAPSDAPGLALLQRGLAFVEGMFGTTAFILQEPANGPQIGAFTGNWNELGSTQEVTLNGKRIFFSVIVECRRSLFAQLPKEGQIVIRSSDGFTGRIVGRVEYDELTVRFPLDTRHK
ncbi:MAG: hypothetical protein P4L99_28080 [Chthoniobacter sp.]|nr:hypothetical protein [Chthoniobacter sp.]